LLEPVCPVTGAIVYIYFFIGLYLLCGSKKDFAIVFIYDGVAFVFMNCIVGISSKARVGVICINDDGVVMVGLDIIVAWCIIRYTR